MRHQDEKLRRFIRACKGSGNFKKLAAVLMRLMRDQGAHLGGRLGLRPPKDGSEALFNYLSLINEFVKKNFAIPLFTGELLTAVRRVEMYYERKGGDLSQFQLVPFLECYYELRKINVPDVSSESKLLMNDSQGELGALSAVALGSTMKRRRASQVDGVKMILAHRLRDRERQYQRDLEKDFSKQGFQAYVKSRLVRKSLAKQGSGKTIVKGKLKDHLSYQQDLSKLVSFSFLGIIVLLLGFGIVLGVKSYMVPELGGVLGLFSLPFILSGLLFCLLYWHYFVKG